MKKFQKLEQSSPLKNGGKSNLDSASTSKKTNHTTENYDEQTESEEDEVSDGEEPDSIWSNEEFSSHL